MAQPLPERVDTCIIGNGPSALIVSYILHGHIPHYLGRHQDELLDSKLKRRRNLLDLSPDLYEHFYASLRYSTQALPVNTLLDTLIRPNADTEVNPESLVQWEYQQKEAITHVVLGEAPETGGLWAEEPTASDADNGTLSYAEMLSLPGYSYQNHYERRNGKAMPDLQRPSRTETADYFASYPSAVGISQVMHTSTRVTGVRRDSSDGFVVSMDSSQLRCKHLVLATGIFTSFLEPPLPLRSLTTMNKPGLPLIVVGSGFSAADVIASAPPGRKIIHVFKWDPENRASPLKGCHQQAYPEYAGIYRQMKLAAMTAGGRRPSTAAVSPLMARKRNPFFTRRDWDTVYEGLPNAHVVNACRRDDGISVVQIRTASGAVLEREVGGLAYRVGRRGTLDYLDTPLRQEVLGDCHQATSTELLDGTTSTAISGKTLRARAENDLEVAPNVFIIGSLTGDSLVRHAFGGCVSVAGKIMGYGNSSPTSSPARKNRDAEMRPNGIAHEDLDLDRRKLVDV